MTRVKLLERVRHNGERFEAGDVLDNLSKSQAKQLVDSGAATEAGGNQAAAKGTKVEREPSKVKENLLGQGKKERKSVNEKAQARAKKASEAKTVDGDEAKTPPAPVTEPGTEDSDKEDTTTPPADTKGAKNDVVEFKLGEDVYTNKADKNGNPLYHKNGKGIKKVDFLTAQKEAGEVA